ncbi:hypothetical protein [Hymenobacter cellulosilyticus]|uniref:Uncharacterized protein n=1 Tax=Hymenobacter cellulosilyticus TaxID=2932248 RepID=A0A8T9PYZ0_9BACT|nr:hypothetical protein [Hymenobacter cellulosilyticus]UOQ70454.1 hypothetical protein MUN79_17145 [Hymenobacter cellulosilyticus]
MNTVEGKFLIASPDKGLYVRLFDFYGLSGVKPSRLCPRATSPSSMPFRPWAPSWR